MRISKNVEMLAVSRRGGHEMTLYMTLAWDEDSLVLFDAGLPGQAQDIAQAIANAGFDARNLTHIILTHQDLDHIGCVKDLQGLAPGVQILAHKAEAPYIDGREMPVKLAAALEKYDKLPKETQEQIDQSKTSYAERRIAIDHELEDGEVLPICGGIEIVHTPGHTPGHISLYLQAGRIMVCGDAANISDGAISGPNPIHTADMEQGMQSLAKIQQFDMAGIVAYHGGYLPIK